MPVDDTVVVAVDTRAGELGVEKVAVGVTLFRVTLDLDPFAADIEPVAHVPVVSDLRVRGIGSGSALPGVHDEREAENDDQSDDHGEESAALEANFLALALLREPGGFFGG